MKFVLKAVANNGPGFLIFGWSKVPSFAGYYKRGFVDQFVALCDTVVIDTHSSPRVDYQGCFRCYEPSLVIEATLFSLRRLLMIDSGIDNGFCEERGNLKFVSAKVSNSSLSGARNI